MRNRIFVATVLVTVGLLVGVGIGAARWRRPPAHARFVTSAVPLTTFGLSGCEKELERYGYSPTAAIQLCAGAEAKPGYHISIMNTGDGGAYATKCVVQAVGTDGKAIPGARVSAPIFFEGPAVNGIGLYVDVGNQVSFDWFLPADPGVPIVSYQVSCEPYEYNGPPI